jgi:hypothetical protein
MALSGISEQNVEGLQRRNIVTRDTGTRFLEMGLYTVMILGELLLEFDIGERPLL